MVDEVRVLRLLRSVTEDLAVLKGAAAADPARHGVLDTPHAARMRQAADFRNVLVHEYAKVDDEIVLSRLADHSDLEEFGRAVAVWLARRSVRRNLDT